jgi:hypothetical protein
MLVNFQHILFHKQLIYGKTYEAYSLHPKTHLFPTKLTCHLLIFSVMEILFEHIVILVSTLLDYMALWISGFQKKCGASVVLSTFTNRYNFCTFIVLILPPLLSIK